MIRNVHTRKQQAVAADGAVDWDHPNRYFGPAAQDRTHQLSFGPIFQLAHRGPLVSFIGHIDSPLPLTLVLPQVGGGGTPGEIFQRADAFLFGRLTYEMFAGSWGTWDNPGNSPIWTALHTKPKYVVSNTLTDPQWTNTTVLSSKIATAVRELKSKPGRELQVHGSVELTQALLSAGLVDRHNLTVIPIVLRGGRGLFSGAVPPTKFRVEEARTTPTGVQLLTVVPDGVVAQGHF